LDPTLSQWYGNRYGDHEGDDHARRRPAGAGAQAGRLEAGAERLRLRQTRSRRRAPRRRRLGVAARRRLGSNGRPPHGQRAALGRRGVVGGEAQAPSSGGMSGITFDAGALIAIDRDDRRVLAILARLQEKRARVTVPATAFAQAIRRPAAQARLARLVRHPLTDLVALGGADATAVGLLLAASRTSDIVDAHVVLCARRANQPIATTDPRDLARLDPDALLVVV